MQITESKTNGGSCGQPENTVSDLGGQTPFFFFLKQKYCESQAKYVSKPDFTQGFATSLLWKHPSGERHFFSNVKMLCYLYPQNYTLNEAAFHSGLPKHFANTDP